MTKKRQNLYRSMKRKNRFLRRSKISEKRFRTFLRWFAAGMTATMIARRARMNRNTVNKLAHLVRTRIAEECRNGEAAAIRIKAGAKFWRYAKLRFGIAKRVHKHRAHLHLKESEWRYANREKDVYAALVALMRKKRS